MSEKENLYKALKILIYVIIGIITIPPILTIIIGLIAFYLEN